MATTAEVAKAYHDGTATQAQLEELLNSYRYLFEKYLVILTGSEVSSTGHPFLSDEAVRIFVLHFRRGGNLQKVLRWVVTQCRRFSRDELYAEVVRTFLECVRSTGAATKFSTMLATNISQLIGDTLTTSLQTNDRSPRTPRTYDPDEPLPPCRAEEIFDDREIVLTLRERELLRLLSHDFNLSKAARLMGVSRQRVNDLYNRLKRKAQTTDEH